MDDGRVKAAVGNTEAFLEDYASGVEGYTSDIRSSVREACKSLQDDISINLTSREVELTRYTTLIARDAEFHTLTAYYKASPGLIAIIIAIAKFVLKVVGIIKIINDFMVLVTGENLAYWLNKLIPGFEEAWNDIMNKISGFSAMLGWGVDGVHHLINALGASADLWGMVTGRPMDEVRVKKYTRLYTLMNSYSNYLAKWQKNPGEQIAKYIDWFSDYNYGEGYWKMHDIFDRLDTFGDKIETTVKDVGKISGELLGIREGMPEFIAKNIPRGVWDGIEKVDTAINDRIIPALTAVNDRVDELNAAIEAQRKHAQELADRVSHPGDLLSEIDSLPLYARLDQEDKIDDIATRKLKRDTSEAWEAERVDLRGFDKVYAAMTAPIPPPEFMELEVPGRGVITGITEEPRETWFVGDY